MYSKRQSTLRFSINWGTHEDLDWRAQAWLIEVTFLADISQGQTNRNDVSHGREQLGQAGLGPCP